MSFLNNFRFAFQNITLEKKIYKEGKYGEKIENGIEKIKFKGVILKEKDFKEIFVGKSNNIKFTPKDWCLRCNVNIEPKIGDVIESFGDKYDVLFIEKVIIEGKHDHNLAIIRNLS